MRNRMVSLNYTLVALLLLLVLHAADVTVASFVLTAPTNSPTTLLHGATSSSEQDDSSEFFIREADFADLGTAARILTDGFFGGKTNFITFQLEKLKTHLSLEATYPNNLVNNNYDRKIAKNDEHVMLIAGARPHGRVIGFAELDARSITTATTHTLRPQPYMCNLATDHKWRRRGVAAALIQQCEAISVTWGRREMYLKVREGNAAAIALYEGLGYAVQSVAVESVQGEDAAVLLLRKELSTTPAVDDGRTRVRNYYESRVEI